MSKSSEYYEKLAKKILERHQCDVYAHLTQDDRPDLQDPVNSIGVEVTSSGDYKDFEADSLFKKVCGRNIEGLTISEKDKIKELSSDDYRFEKSGANGIDSMSYPAKWVSNEHILTGIRRKLEKLNRVGEQSYRDFDNYHLFIFSEYFLENTEMCYFDIEKNEIVHTEYENQIFELIHEIVAVQKDRNRKFTRVYILWVSELYILDIENCRYCQKHMRDI